ncbi:MAG: hypothetical protein ACJAT2_003588 [Bacteriovoracaceae bacterium]|jgi:hypothetical protein
MNALAERYVFKKIDYPLPFDDKDTSINLRSENHFKGGRKILKREKEGLLPNSQVFEGVLVATGWDRFDLVNQSSLYTSDNEDILLVHVSGMKKFKPYINQRVRITGKIVSTIKDERRLLVKRISRLTRGFKDQPVHLLGDIDHHFKRIAA